MENSERFNSSVVIIIYKIGPQVEIPMSKYMGYFPDDSC